MVFHLDPFDYKAPEGQTRTSGQHIRVIRGLQWVVAQQAVGREVATGIWPDRDRVMLT